MCLLLGVAAPSVSSYRSQQHLYGRQARDGRAQHRSPGSNAPTIERIEFEGNRRIRSETLQARIFTRAGDPYSEAGLRRDFQALWNTQYFEDIRLEVQDSPNRPNAKIVIFHVVERPIIRRIEYHGLKSISESDMLDQFKDRKVSLSVESQFDPTKIKKAEVVIKDLEAEHGRQFATVKATYEKIPATNAVKLIFTVNEGRQGKGWADLISGEHRVFRPQNPARQCAIPGRMRFRCICSMFRCCRRHLTAPSSTRILEIGVRGLYQNNGYFKVAGEGSDSDDCGCQPRRAAGPVPAGRARQHGKATNIIIPIEEGRAIPHGPAGDSQRRSRTRVSH